MFVFICLFHYLLNSQLASWNNMFVIGSVHNCPFLKQHKRPGLPFWFSKLYGGGPGDHSSSTFLTVTVRKPNTARHNPTHKHTQTDIQYTPTHTQLYIYTHTIDTFWLKRQPFPFILSKARIRYSAPSRQHSWSYNVEFVLTLINTYPRV